MISVNLFSDVVSKTINDLKEKENSTKLKKKKKKKTKKKKKKKKKDSRVISLHSANLFTIDVELTLLQVSQISEKFATKMSWLKITFQLPDLCLI